MTLYYLFLDRCLLLHNWLLRWISLDGKYVNGEFREKDSFRASMVTSSLHGQSDDPELYAWEHRCTQHPKSCPLAHFQARMELTRYQMKQLLAAVELTPPSENLNFLLPTLYVTVTDFRSLLQSPYAWQDIHASDTELMSRSDAVLRRSRML